MARRICALVRHGDYHQLPDTPSAHQPFPLTEKGIAQARLAGTSIQTTLETHGWKLSGNIDCSTLLRAWQTAEIISMSMPDSVLNSVDQLNERCLGSAANLTIKRIEQIIADDPRFTIPPDNWKADSHYRLPFPGAESLLEAGERVARHITTAMNQPDCNPENDSLKLFIGHGAAFRHAAMHLGVLTLQDIPRLSMYHCEPVYLQMMPDGSWHHIGGHWKIRTGNNNHMD